MKDIDLIPKWYKATRRKQRSLRSQYIILAGFIVLLVVWNFMNANSLSNAKTCYQKKRQVLDESKSVIEKADRIKSDLEQLKKKSTILKNIDSNINIAAIISELSFLTEKKIVLSELKFDSEEVSKSKNKYSGIRISNASKNNKEIIPMGRVKFKGLIRGIADDTSDVGAFVRRLEDSNYFHSVSLAFSRTGNIKLTNERDSKQQKVSEFEISCYLANYKLQDQQQSTE